MHIGAWRSTCGRVRRLRAGRRKRKRIDRLGTRQHSFEESQNLAANASRLELDPGLRRDEGRIGSCPLPQGRGNPPSRPKKSSESTPRTARREGATRVNFAC
jgi:hypothetical protein